MRNSPMLTSPTRRSIKLERRGVLRPMERESHVLTTTAPSLETSHGRSQLESINKVGEEYSAKGSKFTLVMTAASEEVPRKG